MVAVKVAINSEFTFTKVKVQRSKETGGASVNGTRKKEIRRGGQKGSREEGRTISAKRKKKERRENKREEEKKRRTIAAAAEGWSRTTTFPQVDPDLDSSASFLPPRFSFPRTPVFLFFSHPLCPLRSPHCAAVRSHGTQI